MPETPEDTAAEVSGKLTDLPTKSKTAAAEARAQAAEYDSVFAPTPLKLDDGTVIQVPPHPGLGMLDDDVLEKYEEFICDAQENYDRHPDTHYPAYTVKDAAGNDLPVPAKTVPGEWKYPHKRNGVRVSPPHKVQVAQIVIGAADYAKLRGGTIDGVRGSQKHVWEIWDRQMLQLSDRQAADSKSGGGAVDLAAVPPSDSA
jgi:hypothetical protein